MLILGKREIILTQSIRRNDDLEIVEIESNIRGRGEGNIHPKGV